MAYRFNPFTQKLDYYLPASALDHASLLNLDYASAGHTGFEPTLTKGNLTTTTTGLAIGGGTGAVIGAGATVNADTGYGIPTTIQMGNWDTAYGWGNHAGLYDLIGTGQGVMDTHELAYNHILIATALQSLAGAVLTDQTTPQTIGATGSRLAMLWATDITCTNAITGSITGNAITMTVADTADTSCYVGLWEDAAGNLSPKTDVGLTYNAGTGVLTATGFSGPLTGNVTGNCSGTAATVTGATQTEITTCANLVSIGTITTGVWTGTDIAVADGGTGLSTIALGSILAANTANVLTEITSTVGTKYLKNAAGVISWDTVAAGSLDQAFAFTFFIS